MTLHGAGELFDFVAYTFAPAVLVTLLSPLSVLTVIVLGAYFLKERLNILGKLGGAMCLVGSVLIVANAPPDREIESVDEMFGFAVQPEFLSFSVFITVYCSDMISVVCPRDDNTNSLYYLSIRAGAGAVSVMALKAFDIAIKSTVTDSNQFGRVSTYLFALIAFGRIMVQMNYFNKALGVSSQSIVGPIYYVTFTAVLTASFLLFQGFNVIDDVKSISLLGRFLTILTGVHLPNFTGSDVEPSNLTIEYELAGGINARRINMSLEDLPRSSRDSQSTVRTRASQSRDTASI